VILGRAMMSQQQPATQKAISKLVVTPYSMAAADLPEDCPICSEDFKESDPVIYLPCGSQHLFHETCLKEWIKINAVCPLCRSPIV
jgi:E3 ubiquitin-protein ligase DOA10